MTHHFIFVGVTTTQSSIMRIFPRWRDLLGLGDDVAMAGWDLPLHAPPERYRAAVARLKEDVDTLGALVTTHKIDLYRAAQDLFDELDDAARLCGEVSCIAKREGRLLGWAKDPLSAGQALDRFLRSGHFGRTGAEVLCFGAGGAGMALTLRLLARPAAGDLPRRVTITDRDAERLRGLREVHRRLGSAVPVDYIHDDDPRRNDERVAGLPPGSLVVNATGMGKDLPGSPVTDAVAFPQDGIVWELNYRGELTFLRQARRQRAVRHLCVEDGWWYFLYGWIAVMEEVFDRRITPGEVDLLAEAASFARP